MTVLMLMLMLALMLMQVLMALLAANVTCDDVASCPIQREYAVLVRSPLHVLASGLRGCTLRGSGFKTLWRMEPAAA
jgi:hypothetical protein